MGVATSCIALCSHQMFFCLFVFCLFVFCLFVCFLPHSVGRSLTGEILETVTMVTAFFLSDTQSGLDTIPGQRGYLVVSADGSVLQVSYYVHGCFIVRGGGRE